MLIADILKQWQRCPIGLDVGGCGARAVQLKREGDHYVCVAAAIFDPKWEGDAAHDRLAKCDSWIKSKVSASPFRGSQVVLGVGSCGVEYHAVEIPAALVESAGREVKQVLSWEMERTTETNIQTMEIDHWPVPTVGRNTPNVMAVAVPSATVEACLDRCRRSGLQCQRVDSEALALSRMGTLLCDWSTDQIWGLLDVGGSGNRIVLCMQESPILVRHIASGGDCWTQKIADTLQLTVKAAEVQKRAHGLAIKENTRRTDPAPDPGEEVARMLTGVLRSELTHLAKEVKRSFDYVLSCFPDCTVGGLMLVGGSASMTQLPEFLSELLGISVRRSSAYLSEPNCRLLWPEAQRKSFDTCAVAIGLSLGGQ